MIQTVNEFSENQDWVDDAAIKIFICGGDLTVNEVGAIITSEFSKWLDSRIDIEGEHGAKTSCKIRLLPIYHQMLMEMVNHDK